MAVDALYDKYSCVYMYTRAFNFCDAPKIDVIFRGCQYRVRVVQEFKNSRRVLANTKAKDDEATLSTTSLTDAAPPIEPIKSFRLAHRDSST